MLLTIEWNGKRQPYELHRILYPAGENLVVDHINRNKLDNRRSNLRHVSQSVNVANSDYREKLKEIRDNRPPKVYTTRLKGTGCIHHYKARDKYGVSLGREYLGTFATYELAEQFLTDYIMAATSEKDAMIKRVRKQRDKGSGSVYFAKLIGKWVASYPVNGKRKHLGCFLSKELAEAFLASYVKASK